MDLVNFTATFSVQWASEWELRIVQVGTMPSGNLEADALPKREVAEGPL